MDPLEVTQIVLTARLATQQGRPEDALAFLNDTLSRLPPNAFHMRFPFMIERCDAMWHNGHVKDAVHNMEFTLNMELPPIDVQTAKVCEQTDTCQPNQNRKIIT